LALGNASPLFTLFLAALALGQKPSTYQLWSLLPLVLGIGLLLKNKQEKSTNKVI
jgi:drug/metabolite transporter (DMT)-like permease